VHDLKRQVEEALDRFNVRKQRGRGGATPDLVGDETADRLLPDDHQLKQPAAARFLHGFDSAAVDQIGPEKKAAALAGLLQPIAAQVQRHIRDT